jgi:hypothetical protein
MVRTRSDGRVRALLEACAVALEVGPGVAPFASALASIAPSQTALPAAREGTLPVLRWWDECLDQPGPEPVRRIADALRALRPSLAFTQNPHYVASPPSATFLARYGYSVLVGPAAGPPALIERPGLAFGVLLLGPETVYPTHVHPAAELYLPLGRASWSVGGAALESRDAGTPIVHVPNEPHETRTGASPLAALYLWLGDLETAARILNPDSRDPE